jgi:hypothetical protein
MVATASSGGELVANSNHGLVIEGRRYFSSDPVKKERRLTS